MTDQGSTSPVLGDMGKHPMLNLVPLASAGREVTNREAEPEVIDAVRNRLPWRRTAKVMHLDFHRATLGLPFLASVLERAHQFFLFGVDGNHRLSLLEGLLGLSRHILELRVAIGMGGPLLRLAVGLQAALHLLQQPPPASGGLAA